MNCPDCDTKLTEVEKDSGRFHHPGKPNEETPECPVMYYDKPRGLLWYVYKHEPRFLELKL